MQTFFQSTWCTGTQILQILTYTVLTCDQWNSCHKLTCQWPTLTFNFKKVLHIFGMGCVNIEWALSLGHGPIKIRTHLLCLRGEGDLKQQKNIYITIKYYCSDFKFWAYGRILAYFFFLCLWSKMEWSQKNTIFLLDKTGHPEPITVQGSVHLTHSQT